MADVISFGQNKNQLAERERANTNKWFPLNVNKSMMANRWGAVVAAAAAIPLIKSDMTSIMIRTKG